MKIRQCFLELQLEMSGMFFLRHTVETPGKVLKFRLMKFPSLSFSSIANQLSRKVCTVSLFNQLFTGQYGVRLSGNMNS